MKSTGKSFLRREVSPSQLASLIAFMYSCVIILTLTPSIHSRTPATLLLLYYILVPGYCVMLLFGENYDWLQRILFSIFVSISLSLSLLAVNHISHSFDIPLALSLPLISIGTIIYAYFHHHL